MDLAGTRTDTVGRMATSSASLDRSPRKNWVENSGGLPPYVRKIARAIEKERGISLEKAIPYAIGRIKRWAAGGDGVTAATKAKAAAALASWEVLKAKNAARIRETPEVFRDRDDLDMTTAALLEAAGEGPPTGALAIELSPEDLGDLSVLEAAAKRVPLSDAKRKPGESLGAWGNRLKSGDRKLARDAERKKKTKTRDGKDAEFEKLHPRGRGGSWTLKSGASGDEVKAVQSRVGAKSDGKFGEKTKAAVMRYQRKHGLKVDGVVGAQTIASMRGKKGVKPGAASAADRRWLAARAARAAK